MAFLPSAFDAAGVPLHDLRHEAAHGFRRLILHLPGGVGIGAEGEARVVVAKHTGDGLDVHAVLQGQSGESVSEVVEANVLQSSVPEDLLMEFYYRVGVVHLTGGG